jgi:hypothetical protein
MLDNDLAPMRGICSGSRTTKARCRIPRKMEFNSSNAGNATAPCLLDLHEHGRARPRLLADHKHDPTRTTPRATCLFRDARRAAGWCGAHGAGWPSQQIGL